jgi:predicted amidophosphoribosyltransferase
MDPQGGAWGPPCPVCGRPVGDIGAGQCPRCGLPAAGQAALVVARIGATLTDLARDRDALLASLRAAATAHE